MTMWKNWLRTDYRAACNWCKNADCEKIVMVQHEDGTHTANAEQVHALIEQTWIPIFKMHELGTRPTWQHFEEVFGDHIPVSCECAVDELDGEKLRSACKKMKSASAPGADGWRVAELQVLPLQLFEKLAQVLNLVEETGTWPVPLTSGLISLIQKGEGSAPQKLRPIGLMASVYRLWASLRVRDIMHWQENGPTQHCTATDLAGVQKMFGWISRCLWKLRSWKERTWLACRSIGASASTVSHKALLSISLRNKVFTREYCSRCEACIGICAGGSSWLDTWEANLQPQTGSFKVVL